MSSAGAEVRRRLESGNRQLDLADRRATTARLAALEARFDEYTAAVREELDAIANYIEKLELLHEERAELLEHMRAGAKED